MEARQGDRDGAPIALEVAAHELSESLERRVQEIVDAAEERALQIEQEAARSAAQAHNQTAAPAHDTLRAELGRAWAVLGGIEELEQRVADLIGALRTEMESLILQLESHLGPDEQGP